MPASRKVKTFGRSDDDLEKLLAGMNRSQDLVMRMMDTKAIVAAAPPALVKTRSQQRAHVRGARAKL